MTHYAIANLRNVRVGTEIVQYLQRIDATLEPFDGHFIVHGGVPEYVEGVWEGSLIVIAFPSYEHARGWYDSAEYRAILPLRTDNADGVTMLLEGVDRSHQATDVLTEILN